MPMSSATVTVESWSANLVGPSFAGSARLEAVQAAVAASTSDVLCLQQIYSDDDKTSIAAAAAAHFPSAVFAKTTWDTPYDDDTDQMGNTPAYETTGPCSAPDDAMNLDALIKCLATNCSSNLGSEDGYISGGNCFTAHCTSAGLAVISGSDPRSRCGECLVATSSTEKLSQMRIDCTTNPHARFLFNGQSGALLLSALPLVAQETHVVGSTRLRDAYLRATVQLPMNAADVYCAGLSAIPPESILGKYTGFYGNGASGSAAWANEQLLQANKLLDYVTQKTGAGHAVIAGFFNTGPAGTAAGGVVLQQGPGKATWDFLSMSFTPGVASSLGQVCTECPNNSSSSYYNDPKTEGSWFSNLFLFGLPQSAVHSTDRTHTEGVLMHAQGPAGAASDSYGLRSVILVPASP